MAAIAIEAQIPEPASFPTFDIPTITNKNEPRFFCQMSRDILTLDTLAVPHSELRRGVIMPCISYRQKANLVEIRPGDLIPDSKIPFKDGAPGGYGFYWRYALDEAERLLELEKSTEYKVGLVEITALRKAPALYKSNINRIFYGGLEVLPETHAGMLEHLERRLAEIRENAPAYIVGEDLGVLFQVGEQLIEAVHLADKLDRRWLEIVHIRMTKAKPSDPDFQRDYSPRDEECLLRTGVKRLSETEQRLAGALETLAGDRVSGSNQDTQKLIEMMQTVINQLLAERNETKIQTTTKKEKN